MPAKAAPLTPLPRADELTYLRDVISRVVRECPRRQHGSADEARAHAIFEAEFKALGLPTRTHHFAFNDHLYQNIALHFGLGTLGTAVSGLAPALGLALHLACAGSYWAESTRRAYLLRRLFKWTPSRNVLATLPATATGGPRLRLVLIGHVDAAFTGWLFKPSTVERFATRPPPGLGFIERSLALATGTQLALAGFDLARLLLGRVLTAPLRPVEWVLTIPAILATLINLEVVWRDEVVPGANDNLSGTAALLVLARRLAARKPADVEIVLGALGSEETSLGGGDALARDMAGEWDPANTVVIGLDGLGNGDLRILHPEGEVCAVPVPDWLLEAAAEVSASEPRFASVTPFQPPVGGSDVAAFLARGWQGLCLACVDPKIGAPRHYHQPTDTPENLDYEGVQTSIDYAEKLIDAIIARKAA